MNFLSHYGLLRGQNTWGVELSDLQTLELDKEGYTVSHALVILLQNGKRNQDGRLELMGVMRAKNPMSCAIGALAFMLFDQ